MARMDFHTHSILSDGVLLPEELARRLEVLDTKVFALTDHVGPSNLSDIVEKTVAACKYVNESFSIEMIAGVELTHIHPKDIPLIARKARKTGAQVVVVHGETLVEPTREDTNMAACSCNEVDILAHPGILKKEEASVAYENGIFAELTTRQGHCLGNGNTVKVCSPDMLLVNTDAHAPSDFITEEFALKTALASGLAPKDAEAVCTNNPKMLLEKIRAR
jgi:histidinol phosphatase-like PHP family hydrolase